METNKKSKRGIRFKNKVKSMLTNPIYVFSFIAIAFLIYTVIFPLWKIVQSTFEWNARDTGPGVVAGETTFEHWKSVFSSDISKAMLYEPMLNALSIGIVVSILALALGAGLAFLIVKTDFPYKKTFGFLIILPYMLPSWFKAFVWLIVFKNDKVGGSGGLIQYITNVAPPDWLAYGFLPIVLALTTHYYVFSYLLVGAALGSMGSSLEESSEVLGASRFKTLRKITFPLVLPAVLSAFILIISKAIGSFGVPAFLGLPVRYYTLSTMIYSNIESGRPTEGFILSIVLIVLASLIIFFNQRILGKRKYETVGGKDSSNKLIPLGKWKKPTVGIVGTFVAMISVVPLILLVMETLMLKSGNYSLKNLTTHYWIGDSDPNIAGGAVGILKNDAILSAFKNSFILALTASVVAAVLGLIIGYVVTRGKGVVTKTIDQMSFLPYLIPGIALGGIYLSLFSKPTLLLPSLYGTLAILILITVVKELPFATRAGSSTMVQISGELEEAAKVTGASWFTRFKQILLPLSRKGLLSGFILVFISGMKELDLIIMLVTPSTNTLTTLTFDLQEGGYPQLANAIVVIIIIVIIVVYLLTTIIGKTDISKGIGGK